MPRAGSLTNPTPYTMFATLAGLSFWSGRFPLLDAESGIGKISWLLRMVPPAVLTAGDKGPGALLEDERGPYEADRAGDLARTGSIQACGCGERCVRTSENRAGPVEVFPRHCWGVRFYPALAGEGCHS